MLTTKKRKVMKIFIVIPCYNEEAVLPKTLEVLGNLIKNIKVKQTPTRSCSLLTMVVVTVPGS